jgi:uracil-DNA glycosylase
MSFSLEKSWQQALATQYTEPYFTKLITKISEAYQSSTVTVFPPKNQLTTAFTLCPFDKVRVVILGQDPYHQPGQAHGLAFSVPVGIRVPPSLRNIFKELSSDLGVESRTNGNLEDWAKQGVLLLNTTLTVLPGKPGSHQGLGWETFTDNIIKILSREKEHLVFILWGNSAKTKAELIDDTKHLILTAPHPSPLSAYTGFFGSKPFSQTNDYLQKHGLAEIAW